MKYNHLSQNERYQIFSLMKEGMNCTQIANNLGRSKSTISREIRRNKGGRGYRPKQADQLARERSLFSRNARRIEPGVLKAAFERISEQLSPEQIAAELPISHEALYQHIYVNKADGGLLWKNLRCQKKKRKRYAGGTDRRGQIPGRRPIHERPADVETRRTVGHWEGDTVIGAGHKQAIVTLVERRSGYARLMKVSHKTSKQVADAVIKKLRSINARVKTITFYNEINAIGVAQKEQAHPRLSKQPKKYSATSNPQSVVTSTCYLGQRFTIMNTRSCSDGLRSSPNLKQSVAQWKVRTLSTGSYWPQRPYREGSIHWAKLQSNSGKGLMI